MTAQPGLTNPFPRQAVATYGQSLRTSELEYMRRPGNELDTYLREHPIRDRRYGGAIGLRGGHGSGKTHLLIWLAERARALTHARPTVLYAKADSTRLFDLYRQLVPLEDRQRVRELIVLALQNMGREFSSQARITESLKERMNDPVEFTKLFEDGSLDREQLFHMLRDRLQQANVPREIPFTLLAVDSPTLGERAFSWFRADAVGELPELGLPHPLTSLPTAGESSADPDVACINALQALAALHDLADVPLVLLLDQFEVVLRADPQRQQILFSVIKKLVEQVGGQKALVFIAGSDDAWQPLTRDVWPRLRSREPLQIGNLSDKETGSVLDATIGRTGAFSPAAVKTIHDLSGGNMREILQIAHRAFEATGGDLSGIMETVLLRSAETSGSVADQHRLALELADPVLGEQAGPAGKLVKDIRIAEGVGVDRLLYLAASPALALIVVRATDKLSEVDSARRVSLARAYLLERFPRAQLIVTAVGYSSDEVRQLLGTTATIIVFSEFSFPALLRAETVSLIARVEAAGGPVGGTDPSILTALADLAARLDQIGVKRQNEEAAAQERIIESTERLSEAARQERAARTRWEMIDELDSLQAALVQGWLEVERERIRSMLVANETSVKDRLFDHLGGIYLDIVSLVPVVKDRESLDLAGHVRANLIAELRRVARGRRFVDRWFNAPQWIWLLVAMVSTAAMAAVLSPLLGEPLVPMLGPAAATSFVMSGSLWAITALVKYRRVRRWERSLEELRRRLGNASSRAQPQPMP